MREIVMNGDEQIYLTKGSKYVVTSLGTREKPLETRGVFKGYTTIGNDEAISIELDDSNGELSGKMRIIPVHMVLAIDIIEAMKLAEEKDDEKERYFG